MEIGIVHDKRLVPKEVITSGGLGQCSVLNADTGKPLPALEGLECVDAFPVQNAFTGDGRLLALSGVRYSIYRQKFTIVEPSGLKQTPKGESIVLDAQKDFLTVWDTSTGKVVKSWDVNPLAAFNPTKPLLSVFEPNDGLTRLGFWDFSPEANDKK